MQVEFVNNSNDRSQEGPLNSNGLIAKPLSSASQPYFVRDSKEEDIQNLSSGSK